MNTGPEQTLEVLYPGPVANKPFQGKVVRRRSTKLDPDDRYRGLIPLLSEYTQKLRAYYRDTYEWGGTPKYNPLVNGLFASSKSLAQYVSQRLNHIQDEVLKIELQLRLSEFEAMLYAAEKNV